MSGEGNAEAEPILAPLPPPGLRPLDRPPTISVVVPAYEAAATIGEALESILAQDPPPHEVVVSDDGSGDDLDGALQPYLQRIALLHSPHGGVAAARNAGLRRCSGDFVLFADADDLLLPGKLAALARLGQLRPELDLLATDMRFERDGKPAGRFGEVNEFASEDQRRTILERSFLVQPAFRRSRLEAVGGFDESLATGEDWDCVLRMIVSGSSAGLYDEPLAVYRIRAGSLTDARPSTLSDRVRIMERALRDPNLRAAELPALRRSLGVQRRRARIAAAQAAIEAGRPDARQLCLDLARTPGIPPSLRLWAILLAATPKRLRSALARRLATSTSQLSRLLPDAGSGGGRRYG
jgi:glycosyltransferase involved in cell wall biosynthesis